MRPSASFALAMLAGLVATATATAAPQPRVVVIKDAAASTRVFTLGAPSSKKNQAAECTDASYRLVGARWRRARSSYLVNAASAPSYVNQKAALNDIVASHQAWDSPFTTDCRKRPDAGYRTQFEGTTHRRASLIDGVTLDGLNVIQFRSLRGTLCDGAIACTILAMEGDRIVEADMVLERDLTRYGFQDFWTTDDRTSFDAAGGLWAVSDVATHEFGHFLGLDHVDSAALTMFPYIHDGMQTLGLGDMKGVAALYGDD